MTITLTPDELQQLVEAIDSHLYWQLSDPQYRRDGFVHPPGADAPATVQEMAQYEALQRKLRMNEVTT